MKKTLKKRNRVAGAAINSGGFGCVFSPALKCKNSKTKKNYISKLLIKKYGIQEVDIIKKIYNVLKKVPNSDKYYLLKNITLCNPEKLTFDDKENFDDKCENLNKINITESNVNEKVNLNKLVSINIPYGGINLNEWLYSSEKIDANKLIKLNNIIIKMLKNAIIPMSKKKVIHGDIKDKNMLIDTKEDVRIIDWGISGISTRKNVIPKEIINRPLQFNMPFSSLIIGEEFVFNYELFLKKIKSKELSFTETNISTFVINEYLIKLARYYGYYDDNMIIFKLLFSSVINKDTYLSEQKKDSLLEYGYYLSFFSIYITKILMRYTKNYKLDLKKYVEECYIYNSNIWGLLTIYYNIFFIYNRPDQDVFTINDNTLTTYVNNLRDLLVENLFKNGEYKINVKKVIKEIYKLNKILKHAKTRKRHNNKNKNINKKTKSNPKTKKNILSISKF